MYSKYHIEGLVLGSINIGEANKYVMLFTKEMGLLYASAQGLREVQSKLRYSLQDLSRSKIELVSGRGGWRVVSAEELVGYAALFRAHENMDSLGAGVRICRLLKRLLKGEERNEFLYADVLQAMEILSAPLFAGKETVLHIEIVTVMRVLHHLGYWGEHAVLSPFLQGSIEESVKAPEVKKIKSLALQEINKSLQATQL